METHAIAWETVVVTPSTSDFELSVELDADLSSDWELLFNEAAQKDGLSPEERSWTLVRLGEGTIVMRELRPEGREQARRYLDDLVSRTNAALAAKLEEQEQERIRVEQEEAELARTAEELTAWFRSATPTAPIESAAHPAAEDSGTSNREAAENEPPDQSDLRRRLLHSFGAGD